jgi:hypothetical protein
MIYVSPDNKKAQKEVQEKPVKKRNKKQAMKEKMKGMRQEKTGGSTQQAEKYKKELEAKQILFEKLQVYIDKYFIEENHVEIVEAYKDDYNSTKAITMREFKRD